MKIIVFLFIAAIFIQGCNDKIENKRELAETENQSLEQQPIGFEEIIVDSVISLRLNEKFYNPVFMSDNGLIVTQSGHIGLFLINPRSYSIDTISLARGAGFDYSFNKNYIFYIENEYSTEKSQRIYFIKSYNKTNGKVTVLHESDNKSHSIKIDEYRVTWFEREKLISYDLKANSLILSDQLDISRSLISGKKIKTFRNNEIQSRQISEKNNLLKLHQIDNDQLLVEVAGEGVYNYNLKDSSKSFIGKYHSITLSNNLNSFAYVDEENDGHIITSSIIGVKTLNGKYDSLLRELGNDAENPYWSETGNKLAFNTLEGIIKIAYLNFE
jgi:predicted RNA-binding protein